MWSSYGREEDWRPGSFTKNFSWEDKSRGLSELRDSIRIGFAGEMQDVRRDEFCNRVAEFGRIDYIPANFFLFNKIIDGIDYIIADELVFQALTDDRPDRFDKLALFTFNFSFSGKWRTATAYQRRPALWAYHYTRDRVGAQFHWNTSLVTADDIQKLLEDDPRYKAKTTRKLATNLNYLYSIGRLSEFAEQRVERWWVDSLFLALDRLIEDRKLDGLETQEAQYRSLLVESGFHVLSGHRSLEKDLATGHLVSLYIACGGRERFSKEIVRERARLKISDLEWLEANDPRPRGAIHPTNPHIVKSIPRACAMLARYAGFEVLDADELAAFDVEEFVRDRTRRALANLQAENVQPTMSADELMRITRGK